MNGWLNVDKPKGLSSAQVVTVIKHLLKAKKVGHAGTLDPFATGVLPIAINEATKTASFVQNDYKEYSFVLQFGTETDTYDETGTIVANSAVRPTKAELEAVVKNFIGKSLQRPPAYSAIKINGKRSYDLARMGASQVLQPREIEILNLTLENFDADTATFKVCCSKGTYIRSLGHDIAQKLNSCGHVKELRRLKVGIFDETNLISLEKIKEIVYNHAVEKFILPICEVLGHVPAFYCSCEQKSKIFHGRLVELSNITLTNSTKARIIAQQSFNGPEHSQNESLILARCDEKPVAIGITDGKYFKPIRIFNLN